MNKFKQWHISRLEKYICSTLKREHLTHLFHKLLKYLGRFVLIGPGPTWKATQRATAPSKQTLKISKGVSWQMHCRQSLEIWNKRWAMAVPLEQRLGWQQEVIIKTALIEASLFQILKLGQEIFPVRLVHVDKWELFPKDIAQFIWNWIFGR